MYSDTTNEFLGSSLCRTVFPPFQMKFDSTGLLNRPIVNDVILVQLLYRALKNNFRVRHFSE